MKARACDDFCLVSDEHRYWVEAHVAVGPIVSRVRLDEMQHVEEGVQCKHLVVEAAQRTGVTFSVRQ